MPALLSINRVDAVLAKAKPVKRSSAEILGKTIDPEGLANRISALLRASNLLGHNQWNNPAGAPSGKIKHAVLIIGGKRYRGPSHFQALMGWAAENKDTKGMPHVPESNQGFETESGHFLDRTDAADYALGKGLVKEDEEGVERSGRLQSEQLHLKAKAGQLFTHADLTLHEKARQKAQETYEAAALAAAALKEKRKREAAILLLLLLAGQEAYQEAVKVLEPGKVPAEELKRQGEAFSLERQPFLEDFATTFNEELLELGSKDPELAKKLQKQSKAMAATEAQAAYGSAQLMLLKRAGFKTKIWVTENDDRVRPTHVDCADQGEVPIDAAFSNGLKYPGDPNGGPEEVCNCRCSLIGGKRL